MKQPPEFEYVGNSRINREAFAKGKPLTVNPLFAGNSKRQAALAAWPIFGGTTPDAPPATPPAATPPAATPPATADPAPTQPVAPGASIDPNALLQQVQTLTSQITQLQTENEGFKTEKQRAEDAKKTREQQLETTIQQKDAQLEAAKNLISQKALENALLTHKDYQWHDAADALRNIKDHPDVKITVDIDKQIAEIEGVDKAVKDLAEKKSWMLSKGPAPDPGKAPEGTPPAAPTGRPTGTPPAPTTQQQGDKAAKRAAMTKKYTALRGAPVVAQG